MGRRRINDEAVSGRFKAGTIAQIAQLLIPPEKQADFVRVAIKAEIARRIEALKLADKMDAARPQVPEKPDRLEELMNKARVERVPARYDDEPIRFRPVPNDDGTMTEEEHAQRLKQAEFYEQIFNAQRAKSATKATDDPPAPPEPPIVPGAPLSDLFDDEGDTDE